MPAVDAAISDFSLLVKLIGSAAGASRAASECLRLDPVALQPQRLATVATSNVKSYQSETISRSNFPIFNHV